VITLTLPMPISANRYWRSFVLGKRVMVAPSGDAKKYKKAVAQLAREAGITEPLTGRVHVDLEIYPQRPQDWARRARMDPFGWDDDVRALDIDNVRKCLYDSMKGVVFDDDKWVWSDAARRMEPDGEARVVVRITQERPRVPTAQPQLFDMPAPPPVRREELAAKPF